MHLKYIYDVFSSLQCPRLTVHKHLVASLLLFYSSLLVYLEPYVTQRKQGLDYRQYVSGTHFTPEHKYRGYLLETTPLSQG
jgi:hypothetical protein